MLLDGSNAIVLVKLAPIALVLSGTILAGAAGYLRSDIKDLKRILQVVFKSPPLDNEASIRELVRLAVLVKSGGDLELDRAQQGSDDAFLDQASVLPHPVTLLTL
jgi:flagellar motor component MotA